MLVFLIGVRGAGKTSCIDRFRGRTDIEVLQPSTTRPPRDATDREYDFRDDFDVPMAWTISVGSHYYGMRQSEIERIAPYHVGVTVFEPGNINVLLGYRLTCKQEVLIIGLDTITSELEQHARVQNNPKRSQTQREIDHQRALLEEHSDLLIRGDAEQIATAIESSISLLRNRGGIVDQRTMLDLMRAGSLLQDYEESSVQSASYDLRLGGHFLFDGHLVAFTDEVPSFSIPPYSFIIVQSAEMADIPKFLCGRFDLRVSHFMRGVILSNGPQVDPGFRGALFCMLYNASDQSVPIKKGDHFATIEFHTTALNTAANRQTQYHLFANFQRLSADILQHPGSKLLKRIDLVKPGVSKVLSIWTAGLGVFATVLCLFVAWALTTLTDVQKSHAELKRQMEDSKENLQKLQEAIAKSQINAEILDKKLKDQSALTQDPTRTSGRQENKE
ncbi:hypothetical protein [uncultured Pseudacidovorax sp.]|uniref:dCTP deaminase domain-containing protein n=1 Tax=uncultured Pseudacidovorax sp. TaxID=679313 RepID=UPI0025CE7B59|nr:hypothetical protein [uncultured Pseudacidovorax sp.]